MTGMVIGGWVWLCLAVFVVGCLWKAIRYATTPVHLRRDLYPVAHEPWRDQGGSYLEEKEWWTKPRKKDLLGEVGAMAGEILFLEGVREHNRRLWWGSLPFHWGLYLLVITTLGLAVEVVGLGGGKFTGLLGISGTVGGALTAAGAAVLLVLRSSDPCLRPYTSPLDLLNLLVLVAFGLLSVLAAWAWPGMEVYRPAFRAEVLRKIAPRFREMEPHGVYNYCSWAVRPSPSAPRSTSPTGGPGSPGASSSARFSRPSATASNRTPRSTCVPPAPTARARCAICSTTTRPGNAAGSSMGVWWSSSSTPWWTSGRGSSTGRCTETRLRGRRKGRGR